MVDILDSSTLAWETVYTHSCFWTQGVTYKPVDRLRTLAYTFACQVTDPAARAGEKEVKRSSLLIPQG